MRRGFDRPIRIGTERVIHEKHPAAVGQPAVNLHTVVMYLGWLAVFVDALDQPLRPRHGEIAGNRRVMGHDIHVRLQSDISSHRLADAVRAACDACAAMHFVDLNDRGFGVVHRRRRINVLRIERTGKPEIAKFGGRSTHFSTPMC